MLYKSNETLQFLNPLIEEEDFFVAHVTGSDYGALINLYDNLIELMRDHRALFNLVFRLKKIIKAANSMTASLVLTEAMEKIVEETCECLECDRATVFIVDEQKEELWSKVAKGARNTIRIPMAKGIVGYVARTGEIQNIMNAYSDNRFNQDIDRKNNYKTNTILCVPIKDRSNHVIGKLPSLSLHI
jgi:putative methionine-R-sulfoxide reductase with GAF domain